MLFQGPRLLTVALLVSFAGLMLAQTDTGTISGIVTDATGAVIPAALVTVTQIDTNVHLNLSTNGSGFYSAPSLHPGPYSVEVSKSGFQAQ